MPRRTNLKTSLLMPIFLVGMVYSIAVGRTIYVDDDGPADFNNIQAAIDHSYYGNTIIIADGTYTGLGNRDIDFHGKVITVRSENGPNDCIIDCQATITNLHRGFYFHSNEGPGSVLDGLTITNGYMTNTHGAGIYCKHSSPTVTNCIFKNNKAYSATTGVSAHGGGMYVYYGNPTVTNCVFSRNSGGWGGGMCNSIGSGTIMKNCVFSKNSTQHLGGGMFNSSGNPNIVNCIFTENSGGLGGAVYNSRCSPTFTNCIISGNSASYDGGGMCNNESSPRLTNCTISRNNARYGDGICNVGSSLSLSNCILWGNLGEQINNKTSTPYIVYSNVEGGWTGEGNINADPRFVDLHNHDYHLLPGSPCIDTGNNSAIPSSVVTDLDGGPRIRGHAVDMGVYESTVVLFVDSDAPGPIHNGSSWTTALKCLQDALAVALPSDEIRVAQGAYSPEGPLPDIRRASNPNPANGATGVSITVDLSWTAGSDATSHDVYFGMSCPPPFAYNQTATTFDPGMMAYYATYYWRIDELSNEGKTTGAVWSFKTTGPGPSSPPPNLSFPPPPLDRTATFQLKNGVVIKGGYAGFGEPNADARDIEVYETVLSGDIGIQGDNSDNSYHVVTGSGTNETAILDGFTITGGNANGVDSDNNGAGMINYSGSPTLTDCTFSGNSAGGDGGGMYNSDSSPTMNDCTFTSNVANRDGGGMCNWRSNLTMKGCTFSSNSANRDGGGKCNWFSSPMVRNCIFRSNSSYLGGGMFNRSSQPMVKGCTFIGNSADSGGGMWNYSSNPTVTNCTFSGNPATTGGGIFNVYSGPTVKVCIFTANSAKDAGGMYNQSSSPTIEGCTFTDNSATGGSGGGMYNDRYSGPVVTNCTFAYNLAPNGPAMACDSYEHSYPSTVTIVNSIIWNGHNWLWNNDRSTITVAYSDVQGGWPVEDNIDANPRFVDPTKGDYRLWPDSPCINAGDPDYIAGSNETDLDGKPRVIAGRIDMGAYEFNHIPVADAGPNQTVEAQAPWGTIVMLDGSGSSDADSTPGTIDDINNLNWYEIDPCDPNFDVLLGSGQFIDCNLSIGEHIIILEVIDRASASDTNEVTIIVQDTTPPDINCPPDVTPECPADTTPNATGNATATDTCGTVTITHSDQWQPSCGNTGTLARTWTATDESGNSSTCVQIITVVDTTPPVITCPADVTLECPADTSVEANGSATAGDSCGSVTIAHNDQWQPSCGNTGILSRTWTATDESGNSSTCVQIITVVDTTTPDFELSVSPKMLWPPDHKMVEITPSWTVSDDCDATPDVSLVSIVANEGDNTIGDGHTSNDIQINEDGSIYLRSERSGTNTDRIYTITYQAVDDCGNVAVSSATVSIPHDFRLLARIAAQWLWTNRAGRIPEDLNGDGVVNLADFARFAGNWTK